MGKELENQKNINGAAGNDIPQQPEIQGVENRAAPALPDEIKSINDSQQLVVQKQIQPPKIHFEDNKGPLINANVPIDAPAVPKNDLDSDIAEENKNEEADPAENDDVEEGADEEELL